jgi:HlyD family secretion protein
MARSKIKLILPVVLVVIVAAAAVAYLRKGGPSGYQTVSVDRGDLTEVVGATGALQAVTTVQVGSQVSGIIQELHADFNSVVKKDQVIARLDPSIFQARLGQAKANLISARANVDRSRATVDDSRQKYARARELAAQNLLPVTDLETAKANFDSAAAQVKASEAAVSQAEANVNQADLDLAHTVIAAPIDGVVINRAVDVGQTVAASFQAPTLFIIANDLTQMKVNASVDEADIGRVQNGQDVSFRVDAYPDRTFAGRVEQVRLQPTTVQNVVTYNCIVAVSNDDLKLMPGMTATVSIIIRKAENALRIPASALRFRPEGFEMRRTDASAGPRAAAGAGSGQRGEAGSSGMRRASAEGGAPAGMRGGAGGAERGSGGPAPGRGEGGVAFASESAGGARGGAPRRSLVFVLGDDGRPQPVRVATGIADGQFVEVRDGLTEGARVITGLAIDGAASSTRPGAAPSGAANPFNPQFQRRQR